MQPASPLPALYGKLRLQAYNADCPVGKGKNKKQCKFVVLGKKRKKEINMAQRKRHPCRFLRGFGRFIRHKLSYKTRKGDTERFSCAHIAEFITCDSQFWKILLDKSNEIVYIYIVEVKIYMRSYMPLFLNLI